MARRIVGLLIGLAPALAAAWFVFSMAAGFKAALMSTSTPLPAFCRWFFDFYGIVLLLPLAVLGVWLSPLRQRIVATIVLGWIGGGLAFLALQKAFDLPEQVLELIKRG